MVGRILNFHQERARAGQEPSPCFAPAGVPREDHFCVVGGVLILGRCAMGMGESAFSMFRSGNLAGEAQL
jgi:hypothetical protein